MRCKNCRDKFEPTYFNQKYCSKDECTSRGIKIVLEKVRKDNVKKSKKISDTEFKQMEIRVKAPKRKNDLQNEINLLARKIDGYFNFNCIDCNKPMLKQVHGAHLHNVGGNENIRYNLHNIHSAMSQCNKFDSEHKNGYEKGIIERYGQEYFDFIKTDIPKKYNYIGLTANEVIEKLKIVRKLNRDFDTFTFSDGVSARETLNKIIGIYT